MSVLPLIPDHVDPLAKTIARQVLEALFLSPEPAGFAVGMRVAEKAVLASTTDEKIARQAFATIAYCLKTIDDHDQTVHNLAIHPSQVTLVVNDAHYEKIPSRR